jgi:transposase-like protein
MVKTERIITMRCARLSENEITRQRQVEEYESSQMSMKAWCANNGISVSTLRYWRCKLREERLQPGGWVEIGKLQKDDPDSACTAIVPVASGNVAIRVGAFTIEACRDSDAEALKRALSVAASLC